VYTDSVKQQQPPLSEWLTVDQVMTKLNLSQRSIYRLRVDQRIRWKKRRDVDGKQPTPVFHPGDVENEYKRMYGDELAPALLEAPASSSDKQLTKALPEKVGTSVKIHRPAPASAVLDTNALLALAQGIAAAVPAPVKAFLTLPEAAAYTGLTETYLRRQCKEGAIPSIRDRGTKIRKADLDRFAAPQVVTS